jgi:HD-GYP domain-containing protein (c-di-GMP phosphodiesterase class II)
MGCVHGRGTKELSPADALVDIKARPGTEFDPTVIAAAVKSVEDEIFDEPAREGSPSGQPALSA